MVWATLRSWLGVEPTAPVNGGPRPATTTDDEKRAIDERLSRQEADLASLLARVGLDELRSRDRDRQRHAD